MKKNVIASGQTFYLQGDATHSQLPNGRPESEGQWTESFTGRLPYFVRISRRVIVNPAHVTYIGPSDDVFSGGKRVWMVRLTTGKEFAISRRRTRLVIDALRRMSYMQATL